MFTVRKNRLPAPCQKRRALEGLAEEAQEIIDSVEAGPVRDAGLIGVARLLAETLKEEKAT